HEGCGVAGRHEWRRDLPRSELHRITAEELRTLLRKIACDVPHPSEGSVVLATRMRNLLNIRRSLERPDFRLADSDSPWRPLTGSRTRRRRWSRPLQPLVSLLTASFGERAGGTINFADIGVGDPDGDWSRYSKASGFNVNLVAIGNAPSAILNTLVAGGGTASYDVINIVGGM